MNPRFDLNCYLREAGFGKSTNDGLQSSFLYILVGSMSITASISHLIEKKNTIPYLYPFMYEICTAHGPGKCWYLNGANYSFRLHRSEDREAFIKDFIVNFNENCKKAQRASLFPVVKRIACDRLKRYSREDHTGQRCPHLNVIEER